MDTSFSSDSEKEVKRVRKRYKRALCADYKESHVSEQTHYNWTTLLQCKNNTESTAMKDSSSSSSSSNGNNFNRQLDISDLNLSNSENSPDQENNLTATEHESNESFVHNVDNIPTIHDDNITVHYDSNGENYEVNIEDLAEAVTS